MCAIASIYKVFYTCMILLLLAVIVQILLIGELLVWRLIQLVIPRKFWTGTSPTEYHAACVGHSAFTSAFTLSSLCFLFHLLLRGGASDTAVVLSFLFFFHSRTEPVALNLLTTYLLRSECNRQWNSPSPAYAIHMLFICYLYAIQRPKPNRSPIEAQSKPNQRRGRRGVSAWG